MPPITALLHTCNDALRLGRALETIYPCEEILVIDHSSTDNTRLIARKYGARIIAAEKSKSAADFLQLSTHDWILCLDPRESVTESLAASLFEWRRLPEKRAQANAFSVVLREETSSGWQEPTPPQTRLVPRIWNLWQDHLPAHDPRAAVLPGELLRFFFP